MLCVLPPAFNLSCNKSGCCSLRKVVAESKDVVHFLQQNLYMLSVLAARGKLILQEVAPA